MTHPDGTISTRGSKTRTYGYAVEIAPAPAEKVAAELTRLAAECTTKAAAFRAAADNGKATMQSRGFSGRHATGPNSHQATLTGTDGYIYTWCDADARTQDRHDDNGGTVHAVAYLVRYARDMADEYDQQAAKYAATAAETLAAGTPVGEYGILRWSSTAALAAKGLRELGDYYAARGHALRVVAVDTTN